MRDLLHVDDLFDAIDIQICDFDKYNRQTYNLGGGFSVSTSLCELTEICKSVTGCVNTISSSFDDRPADLRIYLTDSQKFKNTSGWAPRRDVLTIVEDINKWFVEHSSQLLAIQNYVRN